MAKFITFEGTEGVGKTTAINGLCRQLDERGIEYVCTREPGGTDFAETLRDAFLDKNNHFDTATEILLVFTARADHLNKVIKPALSAGKWVICDRFIDSTMAYQGFGRYGGDPARLAQIELLSEHFVDVLPDLTLWLDLDVQIGRQRANARGEADRLENEKLAFFQKVHQGFAYQHQRHDRICRIDADGTPCDVLERVVSAVFK